jgi:dynein heavy chain 1, cytosolic
MLGLQISSFRRLLLLQCFRPDRLIDATNAYIFGFTDLQGASIGSESAIKNFVQEINSGLVPVVLLSEKGYDVSYKVDTLALEQSKTLISIAFGSVEAGKLADAAITQAIRTGDWVLLKNAHLDISCLNRLEKRLSAESARKVTMKLFITAEFHPLISPSLLRKSRTIVFAPHTSMKASMLESVELVPKDMLKSHPAEKQRVVFLLIWLHALILERSRYAPIGWTKDYGFDASVHLVDNRTLNSR